MFSVLFFNNTMGIIYLKSIICKAIENQNSKYELIKQTNN